MRRYRSRPAEVEAVRWWDPQDPPEGVTRVHKDDHDYWVGTVQTVGGPATVYQGDYVVAESVPGKFYPCKADVFERRWELA